MGFITSYLATGSTTDSGLSRIGHAALAGTYSQAFVWTSVICAVVIAAAGLAIIFLLRLPEAKVPVDEFLGLDETALTGTGH